MTSCPEALRMVGIWKKTSVSWDSSLEEGSRFLVSARRDQLGVYEMCRAFVEEIVSLSLLISKNLKLKKVNKSFVPELISSGFGFLYVYEYSMNIIIFTQPLRSGRIWHKVNFLSGV